MKTGKPESEPHKKNLPSIEIWISLNGNILLSCTKPFKVSINSELLFLILLRFLIRLNHWKNVAKFTGTTPNLIFEGFWQLENHREKRNSPSNQYITKQNLDWKTEIFRWPLVSTIEFYYLYTSQNVLFRSNIFWSSSKI